MLKSIRLQNFKAHSDTFVSFKDRLTVLVGPNGSGKTSVMEAIWLMSQLGAKNIEEVLSGRWQPQAFRRWSSTDEIVVQGLYSNNDNPTPLEFHLDRNNRAISYSVAGGSIAIGLRSQPPFDSRWAKICGRASLFKLNASEIAKPVDSAERGQSVDQTGANTAAVLTTLKLGDDEKFSRIEESMRRIIPSLKRVRIRSLPYSKSGQEALANKIYFDFNGASNIPADHASEGTLIVLAMLTIVFSPSPPDIILLDDFDQSLHPTAQLELVQLLKNLLDEFKDLQIIATTHSPYILDELTIDQIQCFALRPDGTVATKALSEHPDAQRTQGALLSGELWSIDTEESWILKDPSP